MLRFLADENFNADITRGLLLRQPDLDIVAIRDVGMEGAIDPEVLEWAAVQHRIVLTHDRNTMPNFAYERVAAGGEMMGLFVIGDRFPVGHAIDELLLIDSCSDESDWAGRVVYLPL